MSDHTNPQISRRSIELLALAVLVAIVAAVAAWLVNSGSANAAGTTGGGAAPSGQFAPIQQQDDGSGSDDATPGRHRGDCPERNGDGGSGSGAGTGSGYGAPGTANAPSDGTEL